MTLVDLPFSGRDYFDIIVRGSHLIWRCARFRIAMLVAGN